MFFNKKFSMHDAYTFGVKMVVEHFGFFMMTMGLGILLTTTAFVVLGFADYTIFKDRFIELAQTFFAAVQQGLGVVKVPYLKSVHEAIRPYVPDILSNYVAPAKANIFAIVVNSENLKSLAMVILPVFFILKLLMDLIVIGWTKMALDLQVGKSVSIEYLYKYYRLVPRVFAVGVLQYVIIGLGLMFFIIPGIYLMERLRFARYFVIDKDQSIMQAFQSSWKITDGAVVHLVGYSLFAGLISMAGTMLFVVTFFTIPLWYQVDANIYRQMSK